MVTALGDYLTIRTAMVYALDVIVVCRENAGATVGATAMWTGTAILTRTAGVATTALVSAGNLTMTDNSGGGYP